MTARNQCTLILSKIFSESVLEFLPVGLLCSLDSFLCITECCNGNSIFYVKFVILMKITQIFTWFYLNLTVTLGNQKKNSLSTVAESWLFNSINTTKVFLCVFGVSYLSKSNFEENFIMLKIKKKLDLFSNSLGFG